MKTCNSCKKHQSIDNFNKDKTRHDGLQKACRDCEKKRYIKRQARNGKTAYPVKSKPKKTPAGYRKCRRCKSVHHRDHYIKSGSLVANCEQCIDYYKSAGFLEIKRNRLRVAALKHRNNNLEEARENNRKWQKNNRGYFKNKRKNDPFYSISMSLRDMLNRVLKITGERKTTKTEIILGYSAKDLKLHIEDLFVDGMSWSNREEWHIDHIKPVSRFISDGVTDPAIINALSNLQPLWALDNLKKGNKYPYNGH